MNKLFFITDIKKSGDSCSFFEGEKKYVATGDIDFDKIVSFNNITFESRPSRANVVCQPGDVLFAKMQDTIKVLKITDETSNFIFSTGFYCFKDRRILPDYMRLYFISPHFNLIKDKHCRGATMKAINDAGMSKIYIPLLSLDKQQEVVDSLENINMLINNAKKEIDLLDGLIESKFTEMFGDVLFNDKGFASCRFDYFVKQMNIGPFGSDLKNDCFVPKEDSFCMVYEQKHAIEKTLNVETRYIDKEKYNNLKRFDVGPGDILVSCRGTIGKAFIIPEDSPHGVIHPSLMMIKPSDKVNTVFLLFLLEHILDGQVEQGSGVKMAIKATDLAKIATINPSKKMQDDFASFVATVEKTKSNIRVKMDLLFELLDKKMNEYFGDNE